MTERRECPLQGGKVGSLVAYQLSPVPEGDRYELGRITSWNGAYVFVQYEGDKHSKATRPESLMLLREAKDG